MENDKKLEEKLNQSETEDAKLPESGLSAAQVEEREQAGRVNTPVRGTDLTLRDIIRENVLTYFNLIFLVIAICLCVVGSFRNLTFLPVILANILIGIIQEWRSKSLLDQLTIITQPKTKVLRGGKEELIPGDQLVLDDVVLLEGGNQIPADACVLEGEAQVNESLLTGESDEVSKGPGDELLSGSFLVSGAVKARLTKVGADSYSSRLTLEAKARRKGEDSEMIRALDRLVKIVGFLIIPIAGVLFYQQYSIGGADLKTAVTATAAAVLGMIPEGLYLLASVAMAVSAMRLAMGRVLVHNMKSIETLARVDVLCVDKTGTITENTMAVKRAVPLPEEDFTTEDLAVLELAIGDFAAAQAGDNATISAVKSYFSRQTGKRPERVIPFTPVGKYSGAVFPEHTYVMGAPEFLLGEDASEAMRSVRRYAGCGYRVLVFGEYAGELTGEALQGGITPLGLILLTNPVRESAPETFRYFAEEGVLVKVISGDNPLTVSEVALEAGIPGADQYVDASLLSEEELTQVCETHTVFGRVTPQQKRILIAALKQNGHTVAMTGDGVNDVLALKDADCSIAMASGSDAAARTAQMVLLESDFSRMPSVVNEGRRVVGNIERTASLFLVKNIFSLLMSIFSIIFMVNYPLEPSQVSLISMFTIGVPAFFLSLEENHSRIEGHFLSNVFFRALPAGLTDFAVISALVIFCQEFRVRGTDLSTSCTILLAIVGIMILYRIMSPMTKFHWILWAAMIFGILLGMTFLNHVFAITMVSRKSGMLLLIFAIITEPVLRYLSILVQKLLAWIRRLRERISARRMEREKLFADVK